MRFHDRRDDLDQRLARENDRTLRHGIDVTGKMKVCQIGEKVLIKDVQSAQVVDVIRIKMQVLNIFNDLFHSGADGIATTRRIGAVESVKHNGVIVVVFEISLHHGHFIQICQQGQIQCAHEISPFLLLQMV